MAAWRIVRHPDGRYSRFSETVQNFTHGPLTETEAMDLCTAQLGCSVAEAQARIEAAKENHKAWTQACKTVLDTHGEEEFREIMEELGVEDISVPLG